MLQWSIRLLLTAGLALLSLITLFFTRYYTVRALGPEASMYAAGFVTYALVVVGWTAIWFSLVRWNPTRKIGTALILIAAQLIGFPLGIVITDDEDFGWFLSAVLPTLLFVLVTIVLWVPLPKWRRVLPTASQIPCPGCGYNLRGLTEAVCPECGGRFTLEQLVLSRKT